MSVFGQSRYLETTADDGKVVVTDAVTSYSWTKDFTTGLTWQQALAHCEGLVYGGHSDWRLPNVNQLTDLIDLGRGSPASAFPGTSSSLFWSSSTYLGSPTRGWYVRFDDGTVNDALKSSTYSVRCVRM
ncbi:MAG: hypothetical protein A2284_19120 [Deltaproteobacteria bacterium RIFOXYA12_FULL_61_11]|nr:MAG: hypothetical protein A2284_19120 [Deltaproteobacteria bacterium RIFOXYA12_FULL_61_11]